MTNLEVLKAKINYPLKANTYEMALLERGLISSDDYSVTNKKLIDLAQADCLVVVITSPNVVEGDYQISLTAKSELRKLASSIYRKYGEKDPFEEKSQAIRNATNRW